MKVCGAAGLVDEIDRHALRRSRGAGQLRDRRRGGFPVAERFSNAAMMASGVVSPTTINAAFAGLNTLS